MDGVTTAGWVFFIACTIFVVGVLMLWFVLQTGIVAVLTALFVVLHMDTRDAYR